MPDYMLLIYGPTEGAPGPEEREARMELWRAYTQGLQDAGVLRGGGELHAPETATTVRERGGELQITDGPFAETKEFLGGYYLIECADLDAALEHARRAPSVPIGSVEVRPLVAPEPTPAGPAEAQARA